MSRLLQIARFLLAACACCSAVAAVAAEQITVTASHALSIARPAEMIAIAWKDLAQALPGAYVQKLIIKDAAGHVLPYQVTNFDYDAKGIKPGYAELLFQHDFAAGEKSARFTIEKSAAVVPPFSAKTYARFVPERQDDFAWENDRIGHRAYGPALAAADVQGLGKEVLTASGIDIWSKRVKYLIVDRWYNRGNYHHDDGEGLDMVKTGTTRGTGGTGVWDGKTLHVSGNFKTWKIIANGPIRSIFELTYDAWDVNGLKVAEKKRFTVDAGHNLDRIESTFTFAGVPEITVGLGISRTTTEKGQFIAAAEVFRQPAINALVQWEVEKTNGALGEALILPEDVTGYGEDIGNQLVFARAVSGRPISYYAGAGWTYSGDFASKEDWLAYVAAAAAMAQAPLTVTLSAN